jgi:hypothetical protein
MNKKSIKMTVYASLWRKPVIEAVKNEMKLLTDSWFYQLSSQVIFYVHIFFLLIKWCAMHPRKKWFAIQIGFRTVCGIISDDSLWSSEAFVTNFYIQ